MKNALMSFFVCYWAGHRWVGKIHRNGDDRRYCRRCHKERKYL